MPPPRLPKPSAPSIDLLEKKEFDGHFRRITYKNEDGSFMVVVFRTEDGTEFKTAGNFYGTNVGEPLRIKGQWREHPTYGWTFQMESFLAVQPTTEEGILAFLGSGLIKGVGPATAKKIVEHFGEKTLEVLDHAPECLREVPKLTRATVRKIVDQWNEQKATREAMIFLKETGLTNALAVRLLQHYGDSAVAVLKQNPYRIGMEVSRIGYLKADEIAEKLGIARDAPMRIQAAFVHLLDRASGEGHTYLPREDLLVRANEMLQLDASLVTDQLDEAVAKGFIQRVALDEGVEGYFMPSLYHCERELTSLILGLSRQARPLIKGDVSPLITEFEEKFRFQLAPQQQDALRSVAAGGLCVITGGPGTGKTTLVRALLHLARHGKVKFRLCSPTGRAAQRLAETTRQEAATVHRLLKWNAQAGRFQHGADNKLELDLLIVDEASMLDVTLAYSLLRAVPMGATVVFVGDVDQLPSVGPGMFLRDVIVSGRARTTRLEIIFRQAQQSLIIRNSHRINQGSSPVFPDNADANSDFFFVERDEAEKIREALLLMATERVPRKLKCDPLDDVQVLSPMRRGPLGTFELNQMLQEKLNPNGQRVPGSPVFRCGDKVIQTANNYDLDVYNGDVGRIIRYEPDSRMVHIQFGKRPVFYQADSLDELELAYAITIHKSQGSEYAAVLVVMHTSHFIMLKRNLLYTAITRGKRLVVLLGNKRALHRAIRTSTESERMTALAQWLLRPPEKGELFEA